ncbi:MAG: porin family protein [Bacteroidetes bacterium]|nr:porin family protein [Bacteroidota bacterium]
MKKIALILITFFVVITTTNAQSPLNLGVKIGFNSTKMPTEFKNVSDITDQAKTGFLAGAFVRINLPVFYIQPEIYFTKKGGSFQSATIPQFNNMLLTQQTVLNTIDIPVLAGMKLINLSVFNFRVMAGPVISFVTSKDVAYQINGVAQAINSGTSVTTSYKDKLWGIQVGAGIDVLKFTLDIRYEWGLNNISDSPDMNIKTKLLNVSLGMKFL